MEFIGLTVSQSSDSGRDTAPGFVEGDIDRSAQRIRYQEVMKVTLLDQEALDHR